MTQRTPLYDSHVAANAKIVDFAGWEMPIHYGSQIEEHHAVRRDAGMFDVSHMLAIDLAGKDSQAWLRRLLANDVAKLIMPGKALYSCMLREDGGVIDDLIVYFFTPERYRIVVNAGTADKDVAWMQKQLAGFDATLTPRRDLAMIAIQGPKAREKFWAAFPASRAISEGLQVFQAVELAALTPNPSPIPHPHPLSTDVERGANSSLLPLGEGLGMRGGRGELSAPLCGDYLLARTGYTGEDGFEISIPASEAARVWNTLQANGVAPIGLGARDTLRLEAGMNLYGQDMDESVGPLESGLAWTVDFKDANRDFIGRKALEAQQPARKLVGLLLLDRGVLRSHQKVITTLGNGETTSGSFSPTLNQSIALARVPAGVAIGDEVSVEIRDKKLKARVVKASFARHGKSLL